ncbi:lipoxygenase [Dissophora ornata]|nr:hypothetical protein BGZ58_000952 [Dissophora ornata]KAI8605049.1 lipoxygenase [Dissophora ornata]
MSYLDLNPTTGSLQRDYQNRGSFRKAYARWVLENFGAEHRAKLKQQRDTARLDRSHHEATHKKKQEELEFRKESDKQLKDDEIPIESDIYRRDREAIEGKYTAGLPAHTEKAQVGIVGAGMAGLFAGLILQSLNVEFEVLESSERVGGRIYTWYSPGNYNALVENNACLYGEVGGMRLPKYSEDMLPVQQMALAVNAVLHRKGMDDQKVYWRKFYYDSPMQPLRYNNMSEPTTAEEAKLGSLNFDVKKGGNVPMVWLTAKQEDGQDYLPIHKVLDMVNAPFLEAINRLFAEGFELLMQFDQYSMWDYLTTQFRLGDLGKYYDPEMGIKSDPLPWSVVNFLETTNAGTGMYSVSFVEMVIAVYDWGGSKNPYEPKDPNIHMLTVNKGMQNLPDACRLVLDMNGSVTISEGQDAQRDVGMLPQSDGRYKYDPPNLLQDEWDLHPVERLGIATSYEEIVRRQRVYTSHKVTAMRPVRDQMQRLSGMQVTLAINGSTEVRTYPYVITTLPNSAYSNLLEEDVSFAKAQALRSSNYMSSFKAFITFTRQFWSDRGIKGGVATTDRPIRQIVFPSYGYNATGGVLQVYCWGEDARKLGALGEEERIQECLKSIQYLYPHIKMDDVLPNPRDYASTAKTWFWDQHAGGGAFALFKPGQFKYLYPSLLTPEFDGRLNFAGECCSVHHGWIVGALDSAYNAVLNILGHAGEDEKIKQMTKTWGTFTVPDIMGDPATANIMHYEYQYNPDDRKAATLPPSGGPSIYSEEDYVFEGEVPAFVKKYDTVPQSMKSSTRDKQVLAMLNATWNENVTRRDKLPPVQVADTDSSVRKLEAIYYGNNFQTIPAPKFWLKDDDEFARQQLAGFMPNLLQNVSNLNFNRLLREARIDPAHIPGGLETVKYVADYRHYLNACTITPVGHYLAKPLVLFTVNDNNELMPVGIQLEEDGELFTPNMINAENAWLLAKMQTNCAGQTLHDVGFHQLHTHQICAMVSIALFSQEVFNPTTSPQSREEFQQHPVFKLLRPHLVKALEFQKNIYNQDYRPHAQSFPDTRVLNGAPGVYNVGFIYDLIFSCGRIGNYQLQDKMYNDNDKFRFLDLAIPINAERRGVEQTPFSYAYIHDARLWYDAISDFVKNFIAIQYRQSDQAVAEDIQLQRFFSKLTPAFNHVNDQSVAHRLPDEGEDERVAHRFPDKVKTVEKLHEVLTMFIWQFTVQHTVVNDGSYNHGAFVPNASFLMYPLPQGKLSSHWTSDDVLACLPSQTHTYDQIGKMTFKDIQINASLTGQGPYPETVLGRGVLEPSIDFLQDSYGFVTTELRDVVFKYYQDVVKIGEAIAARQARDTAKYLSSRPGATAIPETVVFDLITPTNVMNAIQT